MSKRDVSIKTLLISLLFYFLSISLIFSAANGISVVAQPIASVLVLSNGGGESNLHVATITEVSKAIGTYTVTVYSANGSFLIGDTYGNTLAYTATYTDHNLGNPFSVPTSISPLTITTGSATPANGIDKMFSISYTINDFALSKDTYSDTLYFTIILPWISLSIFYNEEKTIVYTVVLGRIYITLSHPCHPCKKNHLTYLLIVCMLKKTIVILL